VVPTKSCKTAVKQLLRLEIIVILGLGLPDAFCKNTGHFHRRILDFLGGGVKDEFIQMCTDCI